MHIEFRNHNAMLVETSLKVSTLETCNDIIKPAYEA